MNVYDTANRLAEELKQSEEYSNYKMAKETLNINHDLKNKIKENTDDAEFMRKYKTLMKVPVYVDSPLAISATEVFKQNTDLFDDEIKEKMENAIKLRVPLIAEVSEATNWYDCK